MRRVFTLIPARVAVLMNRDEAYRYCRGSEPAATGPVLHLLRVTPSAVLNGRQVGLGVAGPIVPVAAHLAFIAPGLGRDSGVRGSVTVTVQLIPTHTAALHDGAYPPVTGDPVAVHPVYRTPNKEVVEK